MQSTILVLANCLSWIIHSQKANWTYQRVWQRTRPLWLLSGDMPESNKQAPQG